MTDESQSRPICMWVQKEGKETGSFHEHPNEALKTEKNSIRCTKDSAVAFERDGIIFYACPYHVPISMLERLKVRPPEGRRRKDRISV